MSSLLKNKIKAGTQTVSVPSGVGNAWFMAEMAKQVEHFAKQMAEQIAERILKNEEVMYELAKITFKMIDQAKIKGDKGDKGDKGEDAYTPIKGVDYFDGEKGDKGDKGDRGDDGQDFFTPAERDLFLADLVNRVLMDPSFSGSGIVDKINALELKPELKIDASHISNLPEVTIQESKKSVKLYGGIHRGGLKLIWNTQLEGTIDGVNATFTIPASLPSPKDNRFIVSARGVAKDIDSGDFTVSNNNRTITFTIAPPNGSARPRIQLYHGT